MQKTEYPVLNQELSLSLSKETEVFQRETVAIHYWVKEILRQVIEQKSIIIFTEPSYDKSA